MSFSDKALARMATGALWCFVGTYSFTPLYTPTGWPGWTHAILFLDPLTATAVDHATFHALLIRRRTRTFLSSSGAPSDLPLPRDDYNKHHSRNTSHNAMKSKRSRAVMQPSGAQTQSEDQHTLSHPTRPLPRSPESPRNGFHRTSQSA